MTILQALDGYYQRLAPRGAVPTYGYSRERISYALVLTAEGDLVDIDPLFDTSGKKPQPRSIPVPQAVKRTSGVASNLLWDKTSYVLGVSSRKGGRIAEEHAAFLALHGTMLADTDDEGLAALLVFLAGWMPERFPAPPFHEDMLDANVVFRLDGERLFLHERPAAQALVAERAVEEASKAGFCLVTGTEAPISRLHPAIKGVQGAQSSGARLVSFNREAFESFGKAQGGNAPVSERAAFGYGTALNALLERESTNRMRIGDMTMVFWAEAPKGDEEAAKAAETLFSVLTDPPTDEQEAVKVADVLKAIAEGRPLVEAMPAVQEETRFYILGLSPNAARLSVRLWYETTIGELQRRVAEHWQDLHIDPIPWKTPPAVWRLLYETAAQRKAENIPPLLGGALLRAVLTGGRYPQALLGAVIMRMRADKNVNGLRAAICKACLARAHRLGSDEEDVPVSLDRNEPNPAYRLGRLFAMLEKVQLAAHESLNATIRDRYYGAASATPAAVFPILIRNSTHHISLLRKGRAARWVKNPMGSAIGWDKEIGQILEGFRGEFPRSFRMQEQGRFAIGYYQQKYSKRADIPDDEAAVDATPDAANAEES